MALPVRRYSDINMSFESHPVTGDISLLLDEDAIKRAVKNVIFTDHYERFYQPEKGSGITHLLFENITTITENQIRGAIEDTINNWEPRVDLIEVVVDVDVDRNGYYAKIVFYPEYQIEPVEVDLFLKRVR